MKNPTIATLLNIIPGAGYVYIGGQKRVFGIILLISMALGVIAQFDPALYTEEAINAPLTVWDIFSALSGLTILGAFMYDAYTTAVRRNKTVAAEQQ